MKRYSIANENSVEYIRAYEVATLETIRRRLAGAFSVRSEEQQLPTRVE